MPRTIICAKWGTAFGCEEVNILHRACRANSSEPIRFICLTDDSTGFDPEIEVRPIPDIGLCSEDWYTSGVWPKLALYAPPLHDLGRVLFIDLDMMIVGSLDPFFDTDDGMRFLNVGPSWWKSHKDPGQEPGTGIFTFSPGEQVGILETFTADLTGNMANWRNEQDFVGAQVAELKYWPPGLVLSFKKHLCQRLGVGLLKQPSPPPAGTAVVAFHGTPRPAETTEKLIWGNFPYWHRGRVDWIDAYRRTYGQS